jgi:flagellar motility protein MotE (MotC chaperone)
MTKLLTNKWFAAVIGVVAFAITMAVMMIFQKPAPQTTAHGAGTNAVSTATNGVTEAAAAGETHGETAHGAAEDTHKASTPTPAATAAFSGAVGEPGSLSFNNPDVKTLRDELRRERAALLAKEHQLQEFARFLAQQKQEIGVLTQKVLEAKAAMMKELTNQMTIRYTNEEARVKGLAQVYAVTNMPPASAVQILNGMEVDDVARVLFFMPYKDQAAILENFATNSLTKDTGKATDISQRIRKLGEMPKLQATK